MSLYPLSLHCTSVLGQESSLSSAHSIALKGADHFQNSLFFRHKLEFYSEVEKYLKNDCFKNTEELIER